MKCIGEVFAWLAIKMHRMAEKLGQRPLYNIVYLDDSSGHLIWFEDMIRPAREFRFEGFPCARLAMPHIRERKPDLVVIDQMLGSQEPDGLALAYTIKEAPHLQDVEVVVISQYRDRATVEHRATAPGLLYYTQDGVHFMSKQLSRSELITSLRDIILAHRSSPQTNSMVA